VRENQLPEPLVWILVLHYQGPEHTRACLQSLRALSYARFHVLLLDNGSPDHSGAQLAGEFPEFEYQRLAENQGFAGGCNYGARYCIEQGADWVWFLNNDTVVEPDTLAVLMRQAASSPDAAALSGVIYTRDQSGFHASGGGKIDFIKGKTYERVQAEGAPEAVACEWLSGCNLLVRAAAFKGVGGFNEKYFLYFEDTDLCCRLRGAGWRCLLVPNTRVEHVGGASTDGRLSLWRTYYYTRNRMFFFSTHAPGWRGIMPFFSILTHLARHSLVLPWRGEKGKRQLRAEALGVRDYFRDKGGKAECLDWC
jgi:GT2 family glycosyltransferase